MSDYNVLYSFGALTTIAKYLSVIEFLQLQAVCKWVYNRGVCRVQVRFRLFPGIYWFVDPNRRRTLVKYDHRLKTLDQIDGGHDDVFDKIWTLQVGKDLYTVSWEDFAVSRYSIRADEGTLCHKT